MIAISDLSVIKEVTNAEATSIVGGAFDINSFNLKISAVDITQSNAFSAFSFNAVGSVSTFQ